MKFVEMTGKTLLQIMTADEFSISNVKEARIEEDTILRVNEHGDIEVRRPERWDLVGGLLGDYVERIKKQTGLDWIE